MIRPLPLHLLCYDIDCLVSCGNRYLARIQILANWGNWANNTLPFSVPTHSCSLFVQVHGHNLTKVRFRWCRFTHNTHLTIMASSWLFCMPYIYFTTTRTRSTLLGRIEFGVIKCQATNHVVFCPIPSQCCLYTPSLSGLTGSKTNGSASFSFNRGILVANIVCPSRPGTWWIEGELRALFFLSFWLIQHLVQSVCLSGKFGFASAILIDVDGLSFYHLNKCISLCGIQRGLDYMHLAQSLIQCHQSHKWFRRGGFIYIMHYSRDWFIDIIYMRIIYVAGKTSKYFWERGHIVPYK